LDRPTEVSSELDVRAVRAARDGELEDPLGARVDRPVERVTETRHLAAIGTDRSDDIPRDLLGCRAGCDLRLGTLE
jgi:hypothetical protein